MKFINELQKNVKGRYGVDELCNFLFMLYVVLVVVNLFFSFNILNYLELLIVIIMVYRFLSKNIAMRKKENSYYIKMKNKLMKPLKNIKRIYQDREYYVYKKCRGCKSTLKLPLPFKRGIQRVKCPKCEKKMKFICFRQEKIDVIKKRKR